MSPGKPTRTIAKHDGARPPPRDSMFAAPPHPMHTRTTLSRMGMIRRALIRRSRCWFYDCRPWPYAIVMQPPRVSPSWLSSKY